MQNLEQLKTQLPLERELLYVAPNQNQTNILLWGDVIHNQIVWGVELLDSEFQHFYIQNSNSLREIEEQLDDLLA